MKKRLIKAGVLIVVFFAALVTGSFVINRGVGDKIVDMGAPALPRVSFLVEGQTVNPLSGYVREMDITTMRDTITPLEKGGALSMQIEGNAGQVQGIVYEVYSLSGEEKYADGSTSVPESGETATLQLSGALREPLQEGVLKITLDIREKGKVNYYTRIILPEDLVVSDCFDFARDFHNKAISQDGAAELESYLEPGEASDNTTYQTVNIHSDITHILWGDLAPQVLGDVQWDIQESNSVYTSLLAKYQTACRDEDGETGVYNIQEFFRVRSVKGTIYLLDYSRDMEKVFTGRGAVGEQGILLGIASDDVRYETNEEETMIAFVQERDLWLYDTKAAELTQIFSFADQEGEDARSRIANHEVRITGVDEEGNVSFAVYGYMNRGSHEGEVGAGIYYFDKAENLVTEKAFISSTSSAALTEETLGQLVYYAQTRGMLYALVDGALYEFRLEDDEKTVLAEGLETADYILSEDGKMIAYRTADEDGKNAVVVLDMESGDGYTVDAGSGENLRPLGFINGDFVFGRINPADKGMDASGKEITPIYEVEIRNSKNKEEATYSFTEQGIYTTDVVIEANMLTLNRVMRSGDRYKSTSQEYITNNTERKETKVSLETFSTDLEGKQKRITITDGAEDPETKMSRSQHAAETKTLEFTLDTGSEDVRFYVYGLGSFAGVYENAGDAIQAAEKLSGVVVSSDQAYVWEKGNRDLVHSTEAEAFKIENGESTLEACERYMESYNAQKIDLTGCTLDQVLYVINKGCPVTALISSDHAVMLTGYTLSDVTYIDPENGEEKSVGMGTMEKMTKAGGNVFIGYIR